MRGVLRTADELSDTGLLVPWGPPKLFSPAIRYLLEDVAATARLVICGRARLIEDLTAAAAAAPAAVLAGIYAGRHTGTKILAASPAPELVWP
jgi:hypothetical protein